MKRPDAEGISSQDRYDHFDSPPYMSTRLPSDAFRDSKRVRRELRERTAKIIRFPSAKTLINHGFPADEIISSFENFECGTL
jgi:hypothetical protein